jgi:hypothetical protein
VKITTSQPLAVAVDFLHAPFLGSGVGIAEDVQRAHPAHLVPCSPSGEARPALSAPPQTRYCLPKCAQLVAERLSEGLVGTTSGERCRDPLQMTVDAIQGKR